MPYTSEGLIKASVVSREIDDTSADITDNGTTSTSFAVVKSLGTFTQTAPMPTIKVAMASSGKLGDHYGYGESIFGGTPRRRKAKRQKVAEPITMSDEQQEQNKKEIVEAMSVKAVPGRTHLIAVIIDIKGGQNAQRPVSCHRGKAFGRGYAYDQGKDAYLISCLSSSYLGYIDCAYQVEMPGTGWRCDIPVPDSVVERMMPAALTQKLASIRNNYPSDRFDIQMVQMAGCEV